jgi:hypothetical protein
MTIERDINKRWEEGIDHHPKSYEFRKLVRELDEYGCYKFGGDGDNGEDILYMLDIFFETEDAKNES